MKKVQTQTSTNKNDMLLNTNNIKLKSQINALYEELSHKTKQYNNDILEYNLKVNELELLVEKKDAEYSTEIIQHLCKISDLEKKLREKEDEEEKISEELKYRADKLDEYELKIEELNLTIERLKYQSDKDSANLEKKFLSLQQTMENKSDRTLRCLGDLLNTMRIKENTKCRENETKPPAAMESLVKLLQKSDEQCAILVRRNSQLEQQHKTSVLESKGLKTLLYKEITARNQFQLYIIKMFDTAINGLLSDLKTVLTRLSNDTIPSAAECFAQMQGLTIESVKYNERIRELERFRLYIDECFASNNINSNMNDVPEYKDIQIPVSVLHMKYILMMDTLRHQNQILLYQVQMGFAQQQYINRGFPVCYPPFTNNVPQISIIPQQVPYNNTSEKSSVTIEDVSNTNVDKIEDKNLVSSKVEQTEKLPQTKLNCHEETTDKESKTESEDDTHALENLSPRFKSFKLPGKTLKEIAPDSSYVHAKYSYQDSLENVSEPSLNEDTDFLTPQEMSVSPKNEEESTYALPLTVEELQNNLDCAEVETNYTEFKSEIDDTEQEIVQMTLTNDNPAVNYFQPINDIDIAVTDNASSATCVIDGTDASVLEKLGGSNSLVKLYFFVKDKARVVDMINVTDEELVNAILTVKQEKTLKGMRKKDILKLVLADVRKQKGFDDSLNSTSNILQFCTICFGNDEEPTKALPCKHTFHTSCLEQWFQRDNICPVCRKLVVTVED